MKNLLTSTMFLVVFFFFFLLVSLFLGDGKQPFVDVWWALGILIMYGFRYYQRGKLDLRPPPRLVGFVWITLILYYVILVPFSDSAGYSISATVRLVEGYLAYVLFSTIARDAQSPKESKPEKQTSELFTYGILLVGAVATVASFVFLFFPSFARFLPPMNLLYANYGHNHLADLLLFVFPTTIGVVEKKRSAGSMGLMALILVGMIFTFARGAWILLVFYLVSLFVMNKNTFIKRVSLFVAMVIVVVFLGTALLSARGEKQNSIYFRQLNAFIFKPSVPSDNRLEYWRQAIEAIKERPLFGSGPGTFYLLSRRLQLAPSSWSWFAHSFPLQAWAEAGLVGFVLMSLLLVHMYWKTSSGSLLTGATLLFMYGLYEFVFDYVSLWIVFLAALGVMTKKIIVMKNNGTTQRGMILCSLSILAIFYGSFLISSVAKILNLPSFAFYGAPYVVDAKELKSLGRWETKLIRIMHRGNPDIVGDMYRDKTSLNEGEKLDLSHSIYLDPKNIELSMRTARLFSKTNSPVEEIAVYKHLRNQQMTGIQREIIYDEIMKLIEKNEGNDILLLDLYELAFSYNPWTNGVGHKIYDPTERMLQLIQHDKTTAAKHTLSRFISFWPKRALLVNAEQSRVVIKAGSMLVEILEKEDKVDEAILVIQEILTLDSKRPETIKRLAWLSIKSGNMKTYNAAQRQCEIIFVGEKWCTRLVVDNDLAREWKARAFENLDQGNIVSAVEKLQLAAAAYPYGGEHYRPLVESLVRLGYREEANRVVARCIEFNKYFGGKKWCKDFL